MVFPIFKLTSLFAKTLLKPITNSLKGYARHSPTFEKSCFWLANGYANTFNHLCRILRIPPKFHPLTRDQAVVLGTELVGEGVIFSGAVGLMYYEYTKSSKIPGKCDRLEKRLDRIENKLDKHLSSSFKDN